VVASGHANSADPRALAVPSDFAHLVAGAVWAGGAALVAVVWGPLLGRAGPEGRRAVARHVLPAFGRVALPAFLLVVVTGTISAAVELRRVADLWQTTYGVVLSVKVALVAIAAGVAHRHARRLRPRLLGPRAPAPGVERRHWRLLRAEPLVALGVVAAAGLLVAFPLPPRQATGVVGALAAVAPCDPCPLPAPRAGELAVAGQAGSRVVAAWVRREPSALSATVRVLDSRGRPAPAPTAVAGRAGRPCGRGCAAFRVAPANELEVTVTERGRAHTVALPARWRAAEARGARRLLERAQATMRALSSVRERETVTSGPGTFALTRYRLRAPDRMAFTTGRGVEAVFIGRRQWLRTAGEPFRQRPPGAAPFRTREWFRWTPYARTVALLERRRERGGIIAEVALSDPATPVWSRLEIEEATGRVLRERLVAPARFVARRFEGFSAPVRIEAPREVAP